MIFKNCPFIYFTARQGEVKLHRAIFSYFNPCIYISDFSLILYINSNSYFHLQLFSYLHFLLPGKYFLPSLHKQCSEMSGGELYPVMRNRSNARI